MAHEFTDIGCPAVVVVVDEGEREGGTEVADEDTSIAIGVLDPSGGALKGLRALDLELAGEGGADAYADGVGRSQ